MKKKFFQCFKQIKFKLLYNASLRKFSTERFLDMFILSMLFLEKNI